MNRPRRPRRWLRTRDPALGDAERLAAVRFVLGSVARWHAPVELINFVGRANDTDAVLVLSETITAIMLAGIALVLAGVALTHRRPKAGKKDPSPA